MLLHRFLQYDARWRREEDDHQHLEEGLINIFHPHETHELCIDRHLSLSDALINALRLERISSALMSSATGIAFVDWIPPQRPRFRFKGDTWSLPPHLAPTLSAGRLPIPSSEICFGSNDCGLYRSSVYDGRGWGVGGVVGQNGQWESTKAHL